MKVSRKIWYERVNKTWPETVPSLTDVEAVKAGKKLYRFVFGKTWSGMIRVTKGRRYSWIRRGEMIVNPSRGWKTLVHDLSHRFNYYIDGTAHGGTHARLERRMIKEVLKRGWLEGTLKTIPVTPKEKPSKVVSKLQSIVKRLDTWERKKRRAENAIKKLTRQKKYYERVNEKPN